MKVTYKNISDAHARKELANKYGRMAVPTIVIGNEVLLGFADNKGQIEKLLGKWVK